MNQPANKKRVRLLLDVDVDESFLIRERTELARDVGDFIVNEVVNQKWGDDCDYVVVPLLGGES